ncbi:hypothetical protein GQ53DRAFT_870302 [Thozetella sp. PMI_491]|nr:hypothetical protein GQ53DRAFT_870302 [Thozetella sp. PMI_491]
MGTFSVNKKKYAAICSQMTIQQLRQEETRCIRARYSGGWGMWFGLGATCATGGVAAPVLLYTALKRDKVTDELAIVQAELQSRSVSLRQRSDWDEVLGISSAYVGQAVGQGFDFVTAGGAEGVEAAKGAHAVGGELAKAVPSEAATSGFLKSTKKL